MIRRALVQPYPQKSPQGQRVSYPPCDPSFPVQPLKITNQKRPKVNSRRQRGSPHPCRIEPFAQTLHELIELFAFQQFIEPLIKWMPRSPRHLRMCDPISFLFDSLVPFPHRHVYSLIQIKQEGIWIAHAELAVAPGHPFYERLNELLEGKQFDQFVEGLCKRFYAARMGRPSLTPGIYFRSLLIGYFEGLDGERGIAWRVADSLALRRFLRIGLDESTPDHSTISRTRRLIDIETHRKVFSWVLELLVDRGLLKGQRIGIDATTLEANAAMRSIVRRDTGESYEEVLRALAKESGMETPSREDLARLDRKRKKRTSNKNWKSPSDQDARVAKMKDGSTHLAHKAEHAVDMDTGAILAVTLQGADQGDTKTILQTLAEAGEQIAEQIGREAERHPEGESQMNLKGIEELVTDKGYHSTSVVTTVESYEVRSYIPEKKQKGRRNWEGKEEQKKAG